MPLWLKLLGYAVQALVWWYGDDAHPKIVSKVLKYTPLPPDPNPSPKDRQGPIEKHYGG